ncbi:hypothetical protein ACFQDN_14025 [Pseudomonas asuensis]|jgi:hypothetical protein|uniref:Uncharacterized protein n=1 Tax=Pseudomonas asuensis TaxID=1825787 RepID=A0ABQ2H1L8_9PSED|nr:hypothetical protein [Pseudomonas asuensis]GGM23011.1 hypothetical protein GCM10009425_37340 [Pseudomonas asuensis]
MGLRIFGDHRAWASAVESEKGIEAFIAIQGQGKEDEALHRVATDRTFTDLMEAERAADEVLQKMTGITADSKPLFDEP